MNGDNLSCKYLATDGSIPDQFTITKTGSGRLSDTEGESLIGLNVFPNPANDVFTLLIDFRRCG